MVATSNMDKFAHHSPSFSAFASKGRIDVGSALGWALVNGITVAPDLETEKSLARTPSWMDCQGVRLFCVGGPEGSRRGCERHGKSYLTRRRRGEEGDGGGSLTGGAIPSA